MRQTPQSLQKISTNICTRFCQKNQRSCLIIRLMDSRIFAFTSLLMDMLQSKDSILFEKCRSKVIEN